MSYRIGDVEMQGSEPSNVIHAVFGRKTTDGGKARIKSRRHLLFVSEADTSPSEMNPAQAD